MKVGKTLRSLGVLDAPPDWTKDRKLVHRGFKDLQYLPRTRSGWNCTLAAYAFSARRRLAGPPDLKLWAAMHGLPPSGRYAELGDDALVLWHGTSAARAEKIREHGLFSKGAVWAAIEPIEPQVTKGKRHDRFASTKHETRNPKQAQSTNVQTTETLAATPLVWDFGFRSFEFVWDFVLRISNLRSAQMIPLLS